jgi:hypothetical protein
VTSDAQVDARIARPGDPDLDCHLAGLRLSSVVTSGSDEYTTEAVLEFATADAGGYWTDQATGERVYPDSVTSVSCCFGYAMEPGFEDLAQWQLDVLCAWRDHGSFIEVTCAPGKWTRLHGAGLTVVIPRSEPEAAS